MIGDTTNTTSMFFKNVTLSVEHRTSLCGSFSCCHLSLVDVTTGRTLYFWKISNFHNQMKLLCRIKSKMKYKKQSSEVYCILTNGYIGWNARFAYVTKVPMYSNFAGLNQFPRWQVRGQRSVYSDVSNYYFYDAHSTLLYNYCIVSTCVYWA